MSKSTDKSSASKTPDKAAEKPAEQEKTKAAEATPKAAEQPKADSKSAGKVQVIFDPAGKGDALAAKDLLEAAGFEVTSRKVDEVHNYMSHEDRVYVPSNLTGKSDKALETLRKVRSQLVEVETTEDDTVFAWFIR